MNGLILEFGASCAAVALLVLVVHLAGFSRPARLNSEQEARDIASLVPGGFNPARIGLDREGRGALLTDHSGRLLLLRPHGGQFVPEPVSRTALRRAGEVLLIDDGRGRPIRLRLGLHADGWAEA